MSPSPEFARPPVEEVALSVQFAPLAAMTTAKVARYWEGVRARFPTWNEAPPVDAAMEIFGAPSPALSRFAFSLQGGVVPHRALFVDALGSELVQVQRDRFVRNWRRAPGASDYPRYGVLRDRFTSDLTAFQAFLAHEGVGVPEVNQCEVTYVNHIPAEGWQRHGQLARVLNTISKDVSDQFLPEPETAEATFRYVFNWPGTKEAAGRLHVVAKPVHRLADGSPLFAITLTARGRPRGSDVDEVLAWMDVAHDFLVRGFASMTTAEMHETWGRLDVH